MTSAVSKRYTTGTFATPSELQIDSASLQEIVQFFREPETSTEWVAGTALNVTLALLGLPHVSIAAGPSRGGLASGPYGELLNALAAFIPKHSEPSPEASSAAIEATKAWARRKAIQIRTLPMWQQDNRFAYWLDGSIRNAWVEHAQRNGALFDAIWIPTIAALLQQPKADLWELHKVSQNRSRIAELALQRPDTDEFNRLKNAYALAALLRGYYHYHLVRQCTNAQLMQHPLRVEGLGRLRGIGEKGGTFEPRIAEVAWADLVLRASLGTSNSITKRIQAYAENIYRAKQATEILDLQDKWTTSNLEKALYKNARTAGIVVHGRWIELAASTAIGLASLGFSFVLGPFVGGAVGLVMSVATDATGTSKGLATIATKHRLSELAHSCAGRVTPKVLNS